MPPDALLHRGRRVTGEGEHANGLAELLLALHAPQRVFRTLRVVLREWQHHERAGRAFSRHIEESGGTGYARLRADEREALPATREVLTRLWFARPDRFREQREGPDALPRLAVADGERWWTYDEHSGALSNEGDRTGGSGVGDALALFLDPSPLTLLRLEPRGPTELAGRPALRAGARPRPRRRHVRDVGFGLHRLGHGADEYELVVDREYGVPLRTAAFLDGHEFLVAEVLEIAFDEAFPPDTFGFEAPSGEAIRDVSTLGRPRRVSLAEAAARAPFAVFAPTGVRGARLVDVHYFPGEERPPLPPFVHLSYVDDDRPFALTIRQQRRAADAGRSWVRRELGGEEFFVAEEPFPGEVPVIRVHREGTQIELSSELATEELLAVARSLAPVAPRAT